MEQPTFTETTDPFCLDQADAAALLTEAPWGRYAVIGDSLSAGTGDCSPGYRDQGWSDRVAGVLRSVRPDLDYLNLSEIGATTAQTLENQAARVVEFSPDLLHVPCGANDIVRRQPDFGEIARTLRRMYTLAKGTGALPTTFTLGKAYVVPVFPDWPERIATVNAIVRGLASEYDAIVVGRALSSSCCRSRQRARPECADHRSMARPGMNRAQPWRRPDMSSHGSSGRIVPSHRASMIS
ncbi:SGNH/GDSL hydrolase family protein [Nocardia sp. NPDC052112]|uniref:SGNH/GDSL hydrolase family protein n=1 Tax=Nocardia sp. NPDC052112 TaxID=3155646 RepID=UPI003418FFAD